MPVKFDLQKQAVADLAHRPAFPVPGPKETSVLERTVVEAGGRTPDVSSSVKDGSVKDPSSFEITKF